VAPAGLPNGPPPRSLRPVAPGIRVLALPHPTFAPGRPIPTSTWLDPTQATVAVIDPREPLSRPAGDPRSRPGEPRRRPAVLLTHHHGDHVGWPPRRLARALVGADRRAHPATARRLAGPRRGVPPAWRTGDHCVRRHGDLSRRATPRAILCYASRRRDDRGGDNGRRWSATNLDRSVSEGWTWRCTLASLERLARAGHR